MSVSKSETTALRYKQAASRFLKFLEIKRIDIYHASAGLLDHYVEWLVNDEKLKPSTIHVLVVGAQQYLRWRIRHGDNIREMFKPDIPKLPHVTPTILGPDALDLYLRVVEDWHEPVRTALLVLAMTGIRSSELVSLRLGDIRVLRDGDLGTWIALDVMGKGRKQRIIPALQSVNPILHDYLKGWRSERDGQWLFPGQKDKHVTTRTIRNNLDQVRQYMGIEKLTAHMLRRTYLTLLDKYGVSAFQIAQIAGHARPDGMAELQTTKDHYIHQPLGELMRSLHGIDLSVI